MKSASVTPLCRRVFGLVLLTVLTGVLGGCVVPRSTRFVDVASPAAYGTKVSVISANDEIVRLRLSAPNEPVFLAMVEPKVIDDGLYLFPSYIPQPTMSESVEVPVVELDLPVEWRDRIFWVEGERLPRWYQVFRERVRTIERRHLELPAAPAS